MRSFIGRAARFVISGLITTGISGGIFIPLSGRIGYVAAAALAWVVSVGVGFVLNRRFTFGLTGSEGRSRHLMLFVMTAGLQFLLSEASYAVLMGRLHLPPTIAFGLTLVLTTTFSFTLLNLVVFRVVRAASSSA
jgi:putative flippase GtrA